jgi:hypothetical protein
MFSRLLGEYNVYDKLHDSGALKGLYRNNFCRIYMSCAAIGISLTVYYNQPSFGAPVNMLQYGFDIQAYRGPVSSVDGISSCTLQASNILDQTRPLSVVAAGMCTQEMCGPSSVQVIFDKLVDEIQSSVWHNFSV